MTSTRPAPVIAALFAIAPFLAQSPQTTRVAEGRVTRAATDGRPIPVARQWVVLHRVGMDRSAPLDSVRTDAAGRYRIRYTVSGDPEAIYFVSSRYSGIAYFSPPLRSAVVRGGDADVLVNDTTTDTTGLRLQGRHLVVSAPRGNRREIAEIFEIENAGFRTVVPRDSTTPAWSTIIPARAESTSVGPGDLNLSAVTFRSGRADVFSPISPGIRQLVLTYQLDERAFPLALPVGRPVSVLEVLLEEPRAIVEGAGLAEVAPATVDRRQFRRFLSQDVPALAIMRVKTPEPVEQNQAALRVLAIGVAIAMILSLVTWSTTRRRTLQPTADGRQPTGFANVLIAELATLDAKFEREPSNDERRAAHEREREQLKDRIARELAGPGTPG